MKKLTNIDKRINKDLTLANIIKVKKIVDFYIHSLFVLIAK